MLLLSAALALAPGRIEPQEPAEGAAQAEEHAEAPSAAPKAPVAGMTGFRSKSRVRVSSDPEQVFLLEAFYVFPGRVRWSVLPEGAPASQRRLEYRYGESYWSVARGTAESQALDAAEPMGFWTVLHMELRRAVMLWPDGLAWEGDGSQRRALSAEKVQEPFSEERLPLRLTARLDEAGRPTEMLTHLVLPDGRAEDTRVRLRDITWRQQGDRWWPASFVLVCYLEDWWSETVESVDVGVSAADSFFIPPDRRDTSGLAVSTAPVLVKLPPVVQRRVPLAEGTSWEEALAAAGRARATEVDRLRGSGGRLEEGLVLELDGTGSPRAVLLRLERRPEPLPDGWEEQPAREGVSARRGTGPVSGAALRRLAVLVPAGGQGQAPYLRLPRGPAEGAAGQLVLPFRRPD
jgi:hypothetical protein